MIQRTLPRGVRCSDLMRLLIRFELVRPRFDARLGSLDCLVISLEVRGYVNLFPGVRSVEGGSHWVGPLLLISIVVLGMLDPDLLLPVAHLETVLDCSALR